MADAVQKKAPYSTPSPSAIALLDMCEARAGAKYIERLPEPEGMKAKLGTRCHAITADYLRDGKAPNGAETFEILKKGSKKLQVFYPGRIVRNILHHLPPAGSVPNVERKISLVWGGITFHPDSSIDWETDTGYGDHKFTTTAAYAPKGYAKTSQELSTDAQFGIYGADWFQRHDADETTCQHTYGQFDTRASLPVITPATRAQITTLMNEVIVPKAEKLLGYVAKGVDWRTLPKNTNACGKFPPDGCPFAAQCPRSKQERRSLIMGSAFMEKFKAKKAAAAAAGSQNLVEKLEQSLVSPSNDTKAETPSAASEDIEHDAEEAAAAIVGAINPPGEAGDVIDVKEESEQPAAAAPAQPAAAAPKKPRGRPKKQTVEALLQAAARAQEDAKKTPLPAAADRDQAAHHEDQAAAGVEGFKKSLVLLVDCMPARGMGDVTLASDLIEQAHAHVRKGDGSPETEVLDYRLVEYGKGAGFLSACIAALAADLPHDTIVILETKSPEGMIALQPLMAAATTVIRGV